MNKKVYLVELSNATGKKISPKVMKAVTKVANDFSKSAECLDKSYVNIKFDNEEDATKCANSLLYAAASNTPMFKDCVIDAVQDQPRSERHYLVNFHRY